MASYTTSTKLSVESNIDFTMIDQDLRGKVETVVSNSTLANVAKQHSLCLRSLVMDMSMAKAALEKFKSDWSIVTDLQGRVRTLEGSLAKAERTIQQQQEMLDKQSEIMEYGARMDAIQETLQTIGSENETRDKNADDLRTDHDSLKQRVVDDAAADKKYKDGLKSGKTQISAKAVMVDAEATPLDQVMEARRKVIKRLDEAVFECKETLDRKADTDLVDEVENRSNDNEATIKNMKRSLQAIGIDMDNEDGRPGGLFVEMSESVKQQRGELDELIETSAKMEKDLLNKADVTGVDAKIEHKYQEVVDHLQKAISAAADDEVEFKRVATELQDTVKQLMASKADRSSLLEMKEQILGDPKLQDRLGDLARAVDTKIDRTEAVDMIAAKPDKRELLTDMRRSTASLIKKAIADSQPDSGWATTTTFDEHGRPKTGNGLKGSRTLVCMSCNTHISKPSLDRPNTSPVLAEAAYKKRARRGPGGGEAQYYSEDGGEGGLGDSFGGSGYVGAGAGAGASASASVGAGEPSRASSRRREGPVGGRPVGGIIAPSLQRTTPVMGPGGAALGGGFHVRVPDRHTQSRSGRVLPKLQTRPDAPSRVIIGANGIVYQAADVHQQRREMMIQQQQQQQQQQQYQDPATNAYGVTSQHMPRAGQSLPPHAFRGDMPGVEPEPGAADVYGGGGPRDASDDAGAGRAGGRYDGPHEAGGGGGSSDPSLVKPVAVRTHQPSF